MTASSKRFLAAQTPENPVNTDAFKYPSQKKVGS